MANILAFTPNRNIFTIGNFSVGYYSVIIACSALLAYFICKRIAKYRDIDGDFVYLITVFTIPSAIIGARFLHVALNWDDYTLESAVAFWKGWEGLAIYGAVIFGSACVVVVCMVKKVNPLRMLDIAMPVLLLAQGLGRWGNFFNQELYGAEVNFDFFPFSVFIQMTGKNHIALFFIEFLLNTIGFFVLLYILKKYKNPGVVVASYFIWYGITRFVLEPMRMPQFHPQGAINAFSVISGILILVGLGFLFYEFYYKPRYGNKKNASDLPSDTSE
ncbi:MAG: prolipoprotein diacylglyceryl transferase [Firmicutes bacterium]|nr:prolipoprotein diacylglyceryl transferase [Bacillota bacterium]MCL1953914.1 prolipoprotein diacylglyceryl transferase [Bacillota bacterium]